MMNIKGFIVANGVTDFNVDVWPSFSQTVYNFNIIPQELYDNVTQNNCFQSFRDVIPYNNSQICTDAFDKINTLTGGLNWYDLYRQVYPDGPLLKEESRIGEVEIDGEIRQYKRGFTMGEYTPWLKDVSPNSPILGNYMTDYMNRADVRAALHIGKEAPVWEECNSGSLQYFPQAEGSLWIYTALRNQVRILFFSGDTDGAVPTYGSRRWIQALNWGVKEKWRPWFTNGQVSGYVEKYNGMDFVTVHGVGHMSPQWKRQEVTTMITSWLHNKDF